MKPEPMQHAQALPSRQSPLIKWLDQYGNAATIVACVAMIGGAIWYSYTRTSSSRSEAAWAQYSQARSAEDFGNIADVYSSTEVGTWARLGEGERLLDSGISLMFTDREGALGDLKKADEAFRKVLGNRSGPDVARERASWGLAKSTEAQSDSDTTKAIEGYTALLTQFPKSIYKAAAEERIESLKSPDAKEFYAWFHKQNPKPPELKKPKDGLPDGHPSLDSLMDDKSDGEKPKTEEQTTTPAAESSVVARLKTEVEIEFKDEPLRDALKFIAEKCEIEIEIDGDALKDSGYTQVMKQNLALGKVTGLGAIAAILQKYEKERPGAPIVLVIQEDEKKALITTAAYAEKNKQTPFEFSKPAELSILDRLNRRTEVSFEDMPLQDVCEFLSVFHKFKIELDDDALKAGGFTEDMPQTLQLSGVKLSDVLGAIVQKYANEKNSMVLVIQEKEKRALITTTEAAKAAGLEPFEFPKPADEPKKDDKPKTDDPKPESKDKDAPADSK